MPALADVPDPLRTLIRKLIAPKLEQRPVDATAVANELSRMRGSSSIAGFAPAKSPGAFRTAATVRMRASRSGSRPA